MRPECYTGQGVQAGPGRWCRHDPWTRHREGPLLRVLGDGPLPHGTGGNEPGCFHVPLYPCP